MFDTVTRRLKDEYDRRKGTAAEAWQEFQAERQKAIEAGVDLARDEATAKRLGELHAAYQAASDEAEAARGRRHRPPRPVRAPARVRDRGARRRRLHELARLMGTSVAMIDRTYGHLARDSDESIRARLEARAGRSGDEMASAPEGGATT